MAKLGRPRRKLSWIKWEIDSWLDDEATDLLTGAEQAVWIKLACLAGRANNDGWIHAPITRFPSLLRLPRSVIERTITKCLDTPADKPGIPHLEQREGRLRVTHYSYFNPDRWEEQHYGEFRRDSESFVESSTICTRGEERRGEERREEEKRKDKKPKTCRPKTADPLVKGLQLYYLWRWTSRVGHLPTEFAWGLSGKSLKVWLKQVEEERVRAIIDSYFDSGNQYWSEALWPWRLLVKNFDKLREAVRPPAKRYRLSPEPERPERGTRSLEEIAKIKAQFGKQPTEMRTSTDGLKKAVE